MNSKLTVEEIYAARQSRREHPDGVFDNGGRWYPSEDEMCDCCRYVRSPSRAWPYSLMKHCRTKKHIQSLVERREYEAIYSHYPAGYGLIS